jgi:mono/diheme cytochrome c family protein
MWLTIRSCSQTFYSSFPFFINFPFGYTLTGIDIFAAEGIPAAPFDDMGRPNPYPLMRVQARAAPSNTLGLSTGTVLSSLDAVVPVSGEVTCGECHTSATDGGNGLATDHKGFPVATEFDDPSFGQVPRAVSIAYAWGLNVLRLQDLRTGTHLQNLTPVSCQQCHYSPALDLAHVGPKGPADADANGRQQTLHHSFSNAMHTFHGNLKIKGTTSLLFPKMPSPVGRSLALRDSTLLKSCYRCHPGVVTKCLRGPMFNAGLACQDCHGNMRQVGNDFSSRVSPTNPEPSSSAATTTPIPRRRACRGPTSPRAGRVTAATRCATSRRFPIPRWSSRRTGSIFGALSAAPISMPNRSSPKIAASRKTRSAASRSSTG